MSPIWLAEDLHIYGIRVTYTAKSGYELNHLVDVDIKNMSNERELAIEGLQLWAQSLTHAWAESDILDADNESLRRRKTAVFKGQGRTYGGGGYKKRAGKRAAKRSAKKK